MNTMMWVYRADAYIAGFFFGCLFLCGLMLAIPKPTKCEVSVYKKSMQVEVVQVGVLKTY
jgi:uncharacterized membrane protein YczE